MRVVCVVTKFVYISENIIINLSGVVIEVHNGLKSAKVFSSGVL